MILLINTDFIHSNKSFNRLTITMFNAGTNPDPDMPVLSEESNPGITLDKSSYKNIADLSNEITDGVIEKVSPTSANSTGDTYKMSSKNIIIG